ncbi:MAG TPA: phage tail sheath subtilisin-like domain-containing protein [Pyrinomonadaceae bacterium]|nr:phage tail sheath subtilisin-like domain-containing protein [Pyrinomonadaceae bacterium]
MPEYLSPGVYVEEIDAGPKPIEGVSTSTAGAVGVTAFGPTSGKPELVTSFAEFQRKFGSFLAEPDNATVVKWALNASDGGRWWQFPLAVKGFFDNGGQRLYVKRAFSSGSKASSANMGFGVISELEKDTIANATKLKLRHLIGIAVNRQLRIIRGDTGVAVGGLCTVTGYDSQTGEVTVTPVVPPLSVKRGDFVAVVPNTAPTGGAVTDANATLKFEAKSKGDWGNDLSVRVRPMVGSSYRILASPTAGGAPAKTTLSAEANTGNTTIEVASVTGLNINDRVLIDGSEYTVTAVVADPTTTITAATPGLAPITLGSVAGFIVADKVLIEGTEYEVAAVGATTININPVVPASGFANGTELRKLPRTFDINPAAPAKWPVGTAVQRLRPANETSTPGPTLNVWGASSLYTGAIVELDNGHDKEVFTVEEKSGDTVRLSGNIIQAYYEGHSLRVIEAEVSARYAPKDGTPTVETYSNLRLVKDGSLSNLVNNLKAQSTMVGVSEGLAYSANNLTGFPMTSSGGWAFLAGGDDKPDALTSDDFVGVDGGSGNRTGIQSFEDVDEISICLAPGIWASTVHSALTQHCEILKDRFAILDPQDGLSIEGIRTFREPLDTKYAALYYPWIEVRDPSVKRNVVVAPSGHMAGIYARVDVERGVHKAPANEVVRGITKISQEVTKREHDMLNPKNINVLRFFPGRGNRVWGARCVTSDAAWKYINVRRLFIFVEESIDEGTQWVVFEPNDEPLWARVRATITNFLTSVWRSGALQGAKPDEAFFVKCDHSTMTQDDIDNGRLICIVGIAPVKPAEFVIFRIQQKTLENKV